MKLYCTGDWHANVDDYLSRIEKAQVPKGSIILTLGDQGLNYWLNSSDSKRKQKVSETPYIHLFIRGNHEARPEEVEGYQLSMVKYEDTNLLAYTQPEYPNLHFLADGEHLILGNKVLVLGGAYSVDKHYRLASGNKWWESEQMTKEEREHFLKLTSGKHYDFVLTHTCPYLARPLDKGLSFVDQSKVDSTMEVFLERIRQQTTHDKWMAGHWHIDEIRTNDDGTVFFLFRSIIEVEI